MKLPTCRPTFPKKHFRSAFTEQHESSSKHFRTAPYLSAELSHATFRATCSHIDTVTATVTFVYGTFTRTVTFLFRSSLVFFLKLRTLHFATRVRSVRTCIFIMSPKGGVRKRIAEAQAVRDVVEGQSSSSSHRSGGIRPPSGGQWCWIRREESLDRHPQAEVGQGQSFRQRRGRKSSVAPQRKEPVSCRHCRLQRNCRTSNGLSKPHLGILAAPRGSRGRAFLPHLATSFIHCSVLMIGYDRCSVRGRAGGNLRSDATLEQPNGTGMNCNSRKFLRDHSGTFD